MLRFDVDYDRGGHPTWWLYAADDELVAWAGESFTSLPGARRAASAFKAGAQTARYETYRDAGGSWRWRAWRSSDKVAASGKTFSSRLAALAAANFVRDNAGEASGPTT